MITQRKVRTYAHLVWTGQVLMSWALVLASIGLSAGLFANL